MAANGAKRATQNLSNHGEQPVRLQKLQLRGFKTFADRTEIEFGPGITAIVGPNGAGKSNLTDAILWVLGEQSYRAVRSQKREDVIFAGSDQRAPLGMAEVSLTIDNADGALPIDYSEVVISRRLFRSGQSEYLINGSVVRLKDVADLLIDTGLTPGGYSVIGQGEIDAVLSARPEDRRELIEQVAGIRKYQIRRADAERKLEKTQANLARVKDIIYELSRQRTPLEQQAEVARQYQVLAEQLKRLELSLLIVDWDRRQQKRGQALHDMEQLRASVEYSRSRLKHIEVERERLQEQREEVAQGLEQTREQLAGAERKLDRSQQGLALARQQQQVLAGRRERLVVACKEIGQRREQLQEQLERLAAEAAELQAEVERLTPEVAKVQQALETEQEQQSGLQSQSAALSEQQAELERERALAQREFEAMESLQADLDSRVERLVSQQEQLQQQHQQLQAQLVALREDVRLARQQEADCRVRCQETRQQHAAARRRLREHREKKEILANHLVGLESRAQVLRELAGKQEGFAEGARMVVQAGKEGRLPGILGLVGEMLNVPRRLEKAVEAGLGERLQWVLVEDTEAVKAAAKLLAERGAGRATLLPVDKVPPGVRLSETSAVGRGPGVEGSLRELVRYPRRLAHVLESLLGDILVVHDLEDAWPLRSRLPGPAYIVTLQGEVVGPFGELSAGEGDAMLQTALARKRELADLEARMESLRSYLAAMWEVEEKIEAAQAQAAESVAQLEAEAATHEKEAEGGETQMRQLADGLRAANAAARETEQEVEMLRERRQQTAEKASQAQLSAQGLALTLEGISAELQQLGSRRLAPERLAQMRQEVSEAQVKLAQAQEKLRSASSLQGQAGGELERVAQDENQRRVELEEIEEQLRDLPGRTEAGEQEIATLNQEVEELKERAAAWSQQLFELRQATADLERSRREMDSLSQEQREELYRAELALARAEAQLENLETQLREVYSLSLDEARQVKPADFKEPPARREANRLRSEIRKLGPVNLSAIDEVERLSAREEYLRKQAEDLGQAREDLLEVIAEVDTAATEAFLQGFAQVGQVFQELFEHFFPGGQTDLELTNPEAPLTSGVEVLVRLPGKRRQNLLLLSGGERAMTAIALLFAMIEVRPAPFCVMDEIDAAIDATNTEKLAEIIQHFAKDSQFIVITHNPRTMEAASVLYGVTMRQGGVSRLISVTLEDAKKEAKQRTRAEEKAGSTGGASSRVLPVTS